MYFLVSYFKSFYFGYFVPFSNFIYFIFNFISSSLFWKNSLNWSCVFLIFSRFSSFQSFNWFYFLIVNCFHLFFKFFTEWWACKFLPDVNADIFAASLLILYCSFSSLTLSSIGMISFYILYQRVFWNLKNYLMS